MTFKTLQTKKEGTAPLKLLHENDMDQLLQAFRLALQLFLGICDGTPESLPSLGDFGLLMMQGISRLQGQGNGHTVVVIGGSSKGWEGVHWAIGYR